MLPGVWSHAHEFGMPDSWLAAHIEMIRMQEFGDWNNVIYNLSLNHLQWIVDTRSRRMI